MNDKIAKKPRLPGLQALRALAFLGIFTTHTGLTGLGAFGVSVFFVLSGFLMFYNYADRELPCSFKENALFGIRKIRKLYPLHIIGMFAILPVVIGEMLAAYSTEYLFIVIAQILLNVTLLQSLVPGEWYYFALNGIMWYLSASMIIYALFPLVMKGLKKIGSARGAGLSAVLVFLLQIGLGALSQFVHIPGGSFENFPKWFTYINPFFRLGDFYIGMVLGRLASGGLNRGKGKGSLKRRLLFTALELLTVLVSVLLQLIYDRRAGGFLGAEFYRYTMLFTPASAALVWLFSSPEGFLTKALNNPVFVHIGNISAVTYIIHQIIIKYFDELTKLLTGEVMNVWPKTLITLGITLGLAEVYVLIEKRIGKKKKI